MTATVTARLFDSYGNPWLYGDAPLLIKNMILSETVHIPHVCDGRMRDLVFVRILVEFGEAWYRVRGCE